MIDYFFIKWFAFLSIFSAYGFWRGVEATIKDIGYNSKLFPKYYIKPGRKIARIFRINRKLIPKYLYYGYFMPIVYAILFLISTIIYLYTNGNEQVEEILFDIYALIMWINLIYLLVCRFVYKKAH